MTRKQQTAFVKETAAIITASICRQITDHKVPGSWGEYELQMYLHGCFLRRADAMPFDRDAHLTYHVDLVQSGL